MQSQQDLHLLIEQFDKFDLNRDGKVNKEEFAKTTDFYESEIITFMQMLDQNKDNLVSFDEYKDYYNQMVQENQDRKEREERGEKVENEGMDETLGEIEFGAEEIGFME